MALQCDNSSVLEGSTARNNCDKSGQEDIEPIAPTNFRDLLYDFYRICDPQKLLELDEICEKYIGREKDLQAFLELKYGVTYLSNPTINFYSRFFDPARSLYDDACVPPILDAMPMDSLYKAQKLLPPSAQIDETSKFVSLGKLHTKKVDQLDRSRAEGDHIRPVPPRGCTSHEAILDCNYFDTELRYIQPMQGN